MTAVLDVASGILLVAGALLSLAAAIGLLRLPDVLSRMQAVAKPQGFGTLLLLLGAGLRLRNGFDVTTLVLVALFQLITVPVASQLVGSAAYRNGRVSRPALAHDDLADERASR